MVNRGMKDYVIYSMAKAGLENLTKTLARELAPNVRVNAVAPGAILLPSDGSSQESELINEIPLNRIGTEKDISEAVIGLTKFFLCNRSNFKNRWQPIFKLMYIYFF